MTECPLCHAPGSHLEHLAHGYVLCNKCGRCTKRVTPDVVVWSETNHTPPDKPAITVILPEPT